MAWNDAQKTKLKASVAKNEPVRCPKCGETIRVERKSVGQMIQNSCECLCQAGNIMLWWN